jgi:arylsulfatase
MGDWKLVRFTQKGEWELYDMSKDRSELHDLASAQPDRVKEMAAKWEAWAQHAHVKPYPVEKENGKKKGKRKKARQANP